MPSRTRPRSLFLRLAIQILAVALVATALAGPASAASPPYLVKDIKTGPDSSNPGDITALGDIIVFAASGGGKGYELWRSDGTASGTVRVLDIRPGGRGSNPRNFTRVGELVFFGANDGTHGQELWVTDGTSAGTHLVKDIRPGMDHALPLGVTEEIVVDVDGVAYFPAFGASGRELWHSDGTESGTAIVPGAIGFSLDGLVSFDGRVYFSKDGEFWRSDGTAGGTKPVRKSNGAKAKAPGQILVAGSLLYFTYQHSRLWRTDGTAAGTLKIVDFGNPCGFGCSSWWLTAVGDELFFKQNTVQNEIWKSDGTSDGTTLVRTLAGDPRELTGVGNTLYFESDTLLWHSGGSEATTHVIDEPGMFVWCCFFDIAGTLYFSASTDINAPIKLWRSDGTLGGTEQLGPPSPDFAIELTLADGTLFYSARDSRGLELWAFVP